MSQAIAEPVRMSHDTEGRDLGQLWQRSMWIVVALYWLGIFGGTHWPVPPHTPLDNVDKWMHFSAYWGLAILFSLALSTRRPLSLARSLGVVLLLAGYGALDEVTQPLVGRDCDFFDWCADLTGILLGVSLFLLWAWHRRSHQPE
jgi:VanZ family protein